MEISELGVDQGLAEWREKDATPRRYRLGCIADEETLLADLTEINAREINRPLLDDICKVAEKTRSEGLFVALSLSLPQIGNVVRSLITYGFERLGKEEDAKLTTNSAVILLRLEVNQEDDFVDLEC